MRITADRLSADVRDVFVHAGCAKDEAQRNGQCLVAASLTGHDNHGDSGVARDVEWLREGEVEAGRTPGIVSDAPAFAQVDKGYGFGHLGRIGAWAQRATAAGLVSVHVVEVAGGLPVAPFGSAEHRVSTAPFAAGFPELVEADHRSSAEFLPPDEPRHRTRAQRLAEVAPLPAAGRSRGLDGGGGA